MQFPDFPKNKRKLFAGTKPKDRLSLNADESYASGSNVDMAHGCVILADVVADVAVDAAADVAADTAVDAAADAGVDAAADSAADAAADAAVDAATDAAADATADGVATATSSTWKNLGLVLGGSVLNMIVTKVVSVIEASKNSTGGGSTTPVSQTYWTNLYNEMIKDYPCDNSSASSCPGTTREQQIAMVAGFAVTLSKNTTSQQGAQTYEQSAQYLSDKNALKQALTNVSNTGGIPSMVKYLETYTTPNATGTPLVIATANTLVEVASFVYPDAD